MIQNSTYILVLAATYPELKKAMEEVIGESLTSESFKRFQSSLIYGVIMHDLMVIAQRHSSNYQHINPCLQKLALIIQDISSINYEHLDDEQKHRLPILAKEVDQANFHIREEVYPALMEEKKGLPEAIAKQAKISMAYLQHIREVMESSLATMNNNLGLSLEFTEGLTTVGWKQLKEWMGRNKQIDPKIVSSIEALEKDGTVESFLKAILIMEAMVVLSQNKAISNNKVDVNPATVIKTVKGIEMEGVEFKELEASEGVQVADMAKTAEKVNALQIELAEYPFVKAEEDTPTSKDLDAIAKANLSVQFTTVDKAVRE